MMNRAIRILLPLTLLILGGAIPAAAQNPWLISTDQGDCSGTRTVTLTDGSQVNVTMTSGEVTVRQVLWNNGIYVNKCSCPPNTSFTLVSNGGNGVNRCTNVE